MGDGHAKPGAMRRKDYISPGNAGPHRGILLASRPRFGYTAPFGESSCESGGIGRRTGFRFQRGSPWGFESPLSHHRSTLARIRRACKPVWKPSASSSAGSRCPCRSRRSRPRSSSGSPGWRKNVKVPGFRPGKVPMRMVAQQYGPQVRSDVISDAVQATFADAIREQNLRIAGYPRIEPKAEAAAPDQLEFSAVFEVYPEVKLGDLVGRPIERPADRGRPRRRRQHDRDAAPAAHALRPRAARRRPRATASSSISAAGSTASSLPADRRATSRSSSAKGGCCPSSKPRSPG